MKFRKFGKTVLTAALSSAIVFSLSSCVRSFTVGYMYVTGTVTATPSGNGIITGFKIDNNTGKLTALHGLPVSSGGANPVRISLATGGNFVYVLNRGTNASGGSVCTAADPCKGANVTEFIVGGNGILTPQQTFFSQGINPFRMVLDSSSAFLYVLDEAAPSYAYCGAVITGSTSCGDVTVFSINATTGRLTLVTNSQLTTSEGTSVTYFPVPANPIDFVLAGGYVETLSGAASTGSGQIVYPYQTTSSGQLSKGPSTQVVTNGDGNLMNAGTAITYAGSKVYILDNEPITVSGVTSPSQLLPFTIGTLGALQALVGGAVANDVNVTSPIYLILENKGKVVYVANQAGATSTTGSTLSGFNIDPSSGQLSETPGSPWGTGSDPVCLLEDPSNQFLYTANGTGNSVTGRLIDPVSGNLTSLNRATSDFPLTGPATWCVATGRTN